MIARFISRLLILATLGATLSTFVAGNVLAASFYTFDAHSGALSAPVSQSSLNHALGPEDRIGVVNGHFYRAGPDGRIGTADDSRVRLYGVNLTYSANFPAPENARQIAKRLRSLGFNAVRLHHLDTSPDSNPDSSTSLLNTGPYPSFNVKAISRLRYFIQALKEEGIYTNLNLYVGYKFRPGPDKFAAPGLPDATLEQGSPVAIFYQPLVLLQIQYAQNLIKLLALSGDPALAMVEIRNESSLASTWQSWDPQRWSQSIQGGYAEALTRQWNDWIAQKYGSVAKACERWGDCSSTERQALVSPSQADDSRAGRVGTLGLVLEKIRAAANKIPYLRKTTDETEPTGALLKLHDFAAFVIDTDKRYLEEMKRVVRTAVNFDVPVTGTQMAFGGAMNLLSHAGMDYVDDHFYVDHYQFPNAAWDYNDWRIKDSSLTAGEMSSLTSMSRLRDLRRPFVVSEYNQAYPNRRGAEIMPVVAAYAAAQDWDGLFFFDYADGDAWSVLPSGFRLAGDWSKLALTGQAARIFRSSEIPIAALESAMQIGRPSILGIGAQRKRERRGLSDFDPMAWPADASFSQRRGIYLGGSDSPALAPTAARADSPVKYFSDLGYLVLNSDHVAGFVGQVRPGQRVDLKAFSVESADAQKDFMATIVSTLDGQAFASSRRWLVSVPGQTLGTQPGTMPARPKKLSPYAGNSDWWTLEPEPTAKGKPSGSRDAQAPLWMEKMPTRLILHNANLEIQVYQLAPDGSRATMLPRSAIIKRGASLEITLQMEMPVRSPWYEIVFLSGM